MIVKFKGILEDYMTNEVAHKLRQQIVMWQVVTYSDLTVVSTLPQLSKRHRLVVVRQVIVTAAQSNSWSVPNEFEHKLTLSCTPENTFVALKMSRISSQQPLVNADLITEYKFHLEDAIDRLMKKSKFESILFSNW